MEAQSVPGPVHRVRAWDDQGIGLLAGDGSLYQFTTSAIAPAGGEQRQRLTGARVPEMNNRPLFDVAEMGDEFIISDRNGLRRYNRDTRAWGAYTDPPADAAAQEIVTFNGQLLMRTDRQRLVQSSGRDPVLIGDADGFTMTDATVSDVQAAEQKLYMAGDGKIAAYDQSERRITQRWDLPGGAGVTLKGLVNGQPLALSNQVTTLGETPIAADAGDVLSLSTTTGWIWTDRQVRDTRFLMGHPSGQPFSAGNARCFFRNPSAGTGVERILDARELPAGPIAVTTGVSNPAGAPMSQIRPRIAFWWTTTRGAGSSGITK